MELFSITLSGFRRFGCASMLRTNGKLVALIGPNEAGKSSIIEAMRSLGSDDPFSTFQIARDTNPDDAFIEAKFLLNDAELAAAGIPNTCWFILRKEADGTRYHDFSPALPERNISHRDTLERDLLSVFNNSNLRAQIDEHDADLHSKIEAFMSKFRSWGENLNEGQISRIEVFSDEIKSIFPAGKYKAIDVLTESWNRTLHLERQASPYNRANNAVSDLVPDFLLFDEDQRQLHSSYQFAELRGSVPAALNNLLEVAELPLANVFEAIDNHDAPRLTTLEHRANARLGERFSRSWRQSGVSVVFRLSMDVLEVQVVNEDIEFSALAERSDGLRQFVALHAFALKNHASKPILLIDEAEQKLHYDAQADLVQMLARQELAAKVIYTTHSSGCLPEDLGNGVRLVKPKSGQLTRSEVVNKFWALEGDGLLPLLIGLGATTMAFFPTRRAVLVEGPSDVLLYPSLFREVTEAETLGFQFVPGLSSAGQALAPIGEANSDHVVYLTDGDDGGIKIGDFLRSKNVAPARIIKLSNADKSAVELEDFLKPAILLEAANRLLNRYHVGVVAITIAEIGNRRRMESLEAVYRARAGAKLPKVELAYEILDYLDEHPRNKVARSTAHRRVLQDCDRGNVLAGLIVAVSLLHRPLSPLLATAIIACWPLFVWFLLRRGYESSTRRAGFIYAGVNLAFGLAGAVPSR